MRHLLYKRMCVCVCLCATFPHPFHLVAHGDLQQGGEECQPGAKAVSQDGQLGEEDVERPLLSGDGQQLTVVRPAQLIQTCRKHGETRRR